MKLFKHRIAMALLLLSAPAHGGEYDTVEARAIKTLIKMSDTLLISIPSCKGVGLTKSDKTLGDFVGSLLSTFILNPSASKAVKLTVGIPKSGVKLVPVDVSFSREDGEGEWRWGVYFLMDARTGIPARYSLKCLVVG